MDNIFQPDGSFLDEYLVEGLTDPSRQVASADEPGSFPVWSFFSPLMRRLDESHLKSQQSLDLVGVFVEAPALHEAVQRWAKSLSASQKDELNTHAFARGNAFAKAERVFREVADGRLGCSASFRKLLLSELTKAFQSEDSVKGASWVQVKATIQHLLPLDALEADLIGLAYCREQFELLECYFDGLGRLEGPIIAALLGVSPRELYSRLASWAPLANLDIVSHSSHHFVGLSSDWALALNTLGLEQQARDRLKMAKGLNLPLESFAIQDIDRRLMLKILATPGPMNLLIHGRPGTGKSELARALVHAAKAEPWNLSDFGGNQQNLTTGDVLMARRLLPRDDQVLIIDEAEPYLGTSGQSHHSGPVDFQTKAKINLLLDNAPGKVIWIVNHVNQLDPSTLRRFPFIFSMPLPNRNSRHSLWKYYGEQLGLQGEDWEGVLSEAARDYEVVPSVIAQTLKTVASVAGTNNALQAKAEIHRLVQSQASVGNGKIRVGEQNSRWSLEVLNTSVPAESVVASAKAWLNLPTSDRPGQRFLFHGEPGTGKTEFARQLANQLDLELALYRASDLLSMWVGEAEKNIRAAFEAAQESGALLVIDEIDTFLFPRNQARQSWELSQVNEFLTSLETYRGLFLGTTNSLARLDPAVLRRFHHKVEFRYLTSNQSKLLAAKYFPLVQGTQELNWAQLPALAPGDFAAVADQSQPPIDLDELLEALRAEARLRVPVTRKVGFGI